MKGTIPLYLFKPAFKGKSFISIMLFIYRMSYKRRKSDFLWYLLFNCIFSVLQKEVRFPGRCSENCVGRFSYDWNANRFQSFIYSRCTINRFTFLTQDLCEQVCQLSAKCLTVLKIALKHFEIKVPLSSYRCVWTSDLLEIYVTKLFQSRRHIG